VSEAWDDEGFGGENDWGDESVESDLEEDEALPAGEPDDEDADWDESEDAE
jgi:hypothetical protein